MENPENFFKGVVRGGHLIQIGVRILHRIDSLLHVCSLLSFGLSVSCQSDEKGAKNRDAQTRMKRKHAPDDEAHTYEREKLEDHAEFNRLSCRIASAMMSTRGAFTLYVSATK